MKKFLLSLCVTMLSVVGAWAQDETVILQSGQTELSAAQVQALNLEEDDVLKLYYRSNQQFWGEINLLYYHDAYGNTTKLFGNNNQEYWKVPFGDDDWGVVSYTLTEADVAKLNSGIKVSVNGATLGKLTLTKPVYADAESVTISNTELTLDFNASETLTASVNPESAKQKVIWSATDGTGSVTVDQNGKVTGVAAGTATVRATAKSNPDIYADCTVKVNPPVGISSFTLSSTNVELLKGNKTTLYVTIEPANAADKTVTWSSSDTNVATVNNGEITAVGRGTATITATSASINGADPLTATATVTVKEDLAPTSSDLKTSYIVGDEYTPTIALSDDNLGTIAYASDNSEVIKIVDGKIKAIGAGSANITVTIIPSETAIEDNFTHTPWTKTFTVTVAKPAFGLTIAASPSTVQLSEGGTVNVTPTVTLNGAATDNTDYTISYSLEGASSDITINEGTGVVTVPATAEAQQFNIVATLTPTDDVNYVGATATAKVLVADLSAVVTVSVDANGVYTVNVPYGGASGEIVGGWDQSVKDADYENSVTFIGAANLEGLKNAESVKVTGLVKNSDVAKLIDMIGESNSYNTKDSEGNYINVCKTLDMGGATMAEALALKADGTWDESSWIKDYYGCSLWYLESLTLPKPATGNTMIPTGMHSLWNANATLFNSLTIPEGWTVVGDHAFADGSGNGLKGLQNLKIANSVKNIGKFAFQNLGIKTLYLPNQLETIDEGAFDVTGNAGTVAGNKISPMQDVYFTGPAPRFVHAAAFATCSQAANSTCDDKPKEGKNMPEATRLDYSVATALACLMHYPKEYEADYVDTTRVYYVVDTSVEPYHKGSSATYLPEGWDDTFLNAVKNSTHRTNDLGFLNYNGAYANMVDGGFLDVTYGTDLIWPSHYQMTDSYIIANAGYKWNGEPLDPATQYNPAATADNGLVDRRGLYQFIVAVGNAPKNQEKWEFKYEQGLWYTISLPFDMSVAEIKKVFGAETQVCRFSKVIRDTSDQEAKVLRLEFRKSVMQEGDGRLEDIVYSDTTLAGIRHHYPYMIKPAGAVDTLTCKINPDGSREFPGYVSVPGNLMEEMQKAVDKEGNELTGLWYYYFRPILMEGKLKKNSYVLANYNDKHQFVFFKGVKDADGVYHDGGTARANTAYVQLNLGDSDLTDFFVVAPTTGNDASAPINASIFGDEAVNGIEKVVVVCGDDKVEDNKVYTIGGQLVNGNHLPAGLYIKNGKKFIVK